MRCHFLNTNLFHAPLCIGLLCLSSVTFAQVYKSYDADGNVVFSDKPTQGGSEVEVSKPNVSDSFEVPPPPPAKSASETKPAEESGPDPETQPISDNDSADTNNDGRISRREKEDYRKEQRRKKREMEKAAEGNNE